MLSPQNGARALQGAPDRKLLCVRRERIIVLTLRQAPLQGAVFLGWVPPTSALNARQILPEITRLRVTQAPYERIFWSLEHAIARLTDEIERRAG